MAEGYPNPYAKWVRVDADDVQTLIAYLWDDEERHYQECVETAQDFGGQTECSRHIFITLRKLKEELEKQGYTYAH